jgi:hypothetical protein
MSQSRNIRSDRSLNYLQHAVRIPFSPGGPQTLPIAASKEAEFHFSDQGVVYAILWLLNEMVKFLEILGF